MKQSRQSNFSLLELLVVLCLLFVLAALVLPVYSNGLSRGQKVSCADNLKTIGMALSIYSDDNDDVLLSAFRLYAQDPMQNWLYYLRFEGGVPSENLRCPQEKESFGFEEMPAGARQRMVFSYGMHYEAVFDNYNTDSSRFTRQQQREHGQVPSDHIWIGDSVADPFGSHPAVKGDCSALLSSHGGYFENESVQEGNGWYPVSVRHEGKANLLMFDGHVEGLAGSELFAQDLVHWKPMFYDWKWQERK